MTASEFETRIADWAHQQAGLEALVLGGSRAGSQGGADHLSDWDFHLITAKPANYYGIDWLNQIAPCWCANAERTPRGIIKVSAVFAGGFEVDFVPLAAWQMKLVYAAMKYPACARWMPSRLRRGIHETRSFMLGSGYRLLVSDAAWERRFEGLNEDWPQLELSAEEFDRHASAFWPKAVWIHKKIARPEPRSAMHWLHLLIVNHVYALLAEEARLEGRHSRPEARKAEQWLNDRRLKQTAISTGISQRQLAEALLTELALFEEVARFIAEKRRFKLRDYSAVAAWLRVELAKFTDGVSTDR